MGKSIFQVRSGASCRHLEHWRSKKPMIVESTRDMIQDPMESPEGTTKQCLIALPTLFRCHRRAVATSRAHANRNSNPIVHGRFRLRPDPKRRRHGDYLSCSAQAASQQLNCFAYWAFFMTDQPTETTTRSRSALRNTTSRRRRRRQQTTSRRSARVTYLCNTISRLVSPFLRSGRRSQCIYVRLHTPFTYTRRLWCCCTLFLVPSSS